ncbi:MAG TPA: ribosome assembly RNA-binding protein YhbY [Candidatus Latescibacteria bacterium]|jgi:RNA-binding protein|nr:ribosome assembly RNA-binding protein YhbY [Gemmatimonadota bacterium]MDP7365247.1 ribosome assembly RNA-binding protein YhbY [Candidatus Latescibacterota bacterium]MDP7635177.1 ribosome assembly RNA-binding protein YhbY [Candidatus Latescibacterota bacterium]HCV24578.1 ribosome assembly RNA-binding protein YhbY [Candidatus Latescibacterota bacterium]HJN27424.1 ribosome assembly RNA-binding protein YhbY [Candidatus Latescibacterota bacterium]|tara:strand:+ start:889 stop:1194 length:306 start_codon:yes stop_codon:yes gene_type:complete
MSEHTDLSGKQRRHLRSLAYGLKPTVSVGRQGLSQPVLASIQDAYNTAELVKIRLERAWEIDRKEAAAQLADATDSHLIQVLGRTVLLYRPDPDEPAIQLP